MLLLSKFNVMESDTPPFHFTIDIPLDYSGHFDVSAMAKDGSEDLSDAGTIEIIVAPTAELLELSISPEYAFLNGINDRRQIAMFGEYSDGVERDVSDATSGTEYLSSDPNILLVSDSGHLIPMSEGVVTLIAQNAGSQDSITVEVLNIDHEIYRDRFESQARISHSSGRYR